MPKANVKDPLTTQEAVFAHLVLSGGVTDREAATRSGLSPGSAAYIKSKPQVQAYMRGHRATVQAALAQHEAEALTQVNLTREEILQRYWAFAGLAPEATNNNITGQIKALDSIREMLGYTAANLPRADEDKPKVYRAAWLREDEGATEAAPAPQTSKPTLPKSQAVQAGAPELGHCERRPEPVPAPRSSGVPFGAYQ